MTQNEDVKNHLYDPVMVQMALSAVKQVNENFYAEVAKKHPLLDDPECNSIYMHLSLKKIPHRKDLKTVQVQLPHSLLKDDTQVCLITGDLDRSNREAESDPVLLHYKELLKENGVNQITEVMPLRRLRTEYRTFETKRHLAAAYDVFLADKKVVQNLPHLLGKAFYKNKKFPFQINLQSTNLKREIEKALSKTKFILNGRGTSYSWKIARIDMEDGDIMENVETSLKALMNGIPGGWENIKGISLKTEKSKAIPIYVSFGNPKNIKIYRKRKVEDPDEGELSTLPNAAVKVFKSGAIKVIKTEDLDDEEDAEIFPDTLYDTNMNKKRKIKKLKA